jgi:hypothetical protein
MGPAELLAFAQDPALGADYVVVQSWAVGWGTLSLINAGLAQGKGRSGLAWFLISLLLGPIATLLIVVLERVPIIPKG